jgi:tetratricopeptide (TPR) repeat protein
VGLKTAGVCLIALFLFSLPLEADDREIARTYFLKARDIYNGGNADEAEYLLRQAVAFLPGYSETSFLLGKILCARQESTAEGVAFIERAMNLKSWTDTSPLEARAVEAGVFLRTRRFREALATYNELRQEEVYSSANERGRALAAFGLGDVKLADALFSAALTEFPEDSRLYLAFIKNLIQRGQTARAQALVERGMREFPEEAGFVFYKTALDRDAKTRKSDFALYREKGGRDPAVALYLLDSDNDTFAQALDFFFNQNGDNSVLLIESLMNGLRQNKARRDAAAKRLGSLEGEKTVDADGDGFYEEKYVFKGNSLTSVIIDRNQDGVPEAEIAFDRNAPKNITVQRKAGGTVRFDYNGYPRLSTAVVTTRDGTKQYDLIPDALRFAPLASLPAPANFKLRVAWPAAPAVPDETRLNRAAFARTEDPADKSKPIKKWDLDAGRDRVLHEDTFRTGKYDRIITYDAKGLPVRGQIDIDGDGYFEIEETYVRGVLTRIGYDENKDGRFDYWQDATGNTLEWDLNGDGKPDVIGRRGANGKIIADYSGLLRSK